DRRRLPRGARGGLGETALPKSADCVTSVEQKKTKGTKKTFHFICLPCFVFAAFVSFRSKQWLVSI
ncbi:MAG: hypothetical protein LBC18_09410, partial [Opitutaceae bacterium]|nr:hypothetical protein [Opitutaceae bacterium]